MPEKKNAAEPLWSDGCEGRGIAPGEECRDCLHQREHFGYSLVDGEWVAGAA